MITQNGWQILMEILSRHSVELRDRLREGNIERLNRDELLNVLEALGGELCETGLDPDDEPNARGRAIEDLIGGFSLAVQRLENISGSDSS